MKKFNSSRLFVMAMVFILVFASISYAEEVFVISDIKEFAREYVNAIKALQVENPEAIPIFQMEVVERLEKGEIRFRNEREDIASEIRSMKNTKTQALNKSETIEKVSSLGENRKAEVEIVKSRENNRDDGIASDSKESGQGGGHDSGGATGSLQPKHP
ncbi:MAG: hypothetical protein PHT41_04275 [Candidatus Omnitrophica bacterium]|nr:hypothetical protein [Candidatus Omnitrophota bacterium]MDD5237548.1 hypothetical protein [Candidatus Omnitrophota bacterium]